ncbi:hypothetical protein BH20ACT8_BH20ACT8_09430 [soil metagenome]
MACVQTLVGARPITERADVEEGFAALYRDQYRPMVRVAFLMTSDNAVADEFVQDAFVRVYRKFDRVENPAAYLRRAVTNACRSHHRRRFLEKAHEPERPLPAGPPEIDVMWEQLQQLTPKRRMALVRRFYEDLRSMRSPRSWTAAPEPSNRWSTAGWRRCARWWRHDRAPRAARARDLPVEGGHGRVQR